MDYGKGRCVDYWCVQGPAAQTWTSRLFRLLTLLCTGLPARAAGVGRVKFDSHPTWKSAPEKIFLEDTFLHPSGVRIL